MSPFVTLTPPLVGHKEDDDQQQEEFYDVVVVHRA